MRELGVSSPADIRTFKDLDATGFRITREDMQQRMPEILRDDAGFVKYFNTSGTTGNMVEIPWDLADMFGAQG